MPCWKRVNSENKTISGHGMLVDFWSLPQNDFQHETHKLFSLCGKSWTKWTHERCSEFRLVLRSLSQVNQRAWKTGYLNVMNIKKITEDMNFHDSIACINVISGSNEVISRSAFEGSFFSSVDFSSKASWRLLLWFFSSFGLEDFFSSKRLLFPLRIFCPKNEFSNEVKSAVTVLNGEKQNVFIQIKIVEYEKNLLKFSNITYII